MKPKNLLPRLTAPVSRGDSQATIGRLQFKAGVSGSYFNPIACASSCYKPFYTQGGGQAYIPDISCVLRSCAVDYLIDKARSRHAANEYISMLQGLRY